MADVVAARTLTRRAFVASTGAGLIAAPLATLGAAGANAADAKPGAGAAPGAGMPGAPPRAVGRPMPELERPLADPPERRLGWAVVGLGDFALNHMLPAIARSRHCRLTAVVSGNRDKARAVAAAYGVPERGVYDYDGFDRIRDDPTVDVVYIVLPNTLHAEWTVRAAQAGKHVFCEKPMAATEAECRQMIDACAKAGRRLMIAYRAPFEPHNREAIRMIRAGEIGPVREIVADHGRPLEPKKPADEWRAQAALAAGGSLYDIGIYSLNGARYLTGEEPIELRATFRKPPGSPGPDGRPVDVDQGIAWTMRFPSGAIAHCTSAYDFANVKRIQVMGEKASLALDPATEYEGNRLLVRRETGQMEPKLGESSEQFVGELDEFAMAIRENREPRHGSGREGLQDVRLMQLIYEAARTGRPVAVPPLR
jgi:predicted dehydrogenase